VDTLCVVPIRATKRGEERTPLDGSHDVLICGASFAGLAVARELAGSGADVLVIDRYEIGERQTSACGIPTDWMRAMGLEWIQRLVQEPGRLFKRYVIHDIPFAIRLLVHAAARRFHASQTPPPPAV